MQPLTLPSLGQTLSIPQPRNDTKCKSVTPEHLPWHSLSATCFALLQRNPNVEIQTKQKHSNSPTVS
jgi:hypothetical protein